MRVVVVTPLFSIAGVPLAQVRFARALADAGHSVRLVIGHLEPGYEPPSPPGVAVSIWQCARVRDMLFPLVRLLKEEAPEVVFSAEDHLNCCVLLAAVLARSRAKVSCSSRVTPFDTYSDVPFSKRWLLKQLMKCLMARADALTCVSKDMVEQYRKVFSGAPHVCVYNIVGDGSSPERMREPVEHPWAARKETPLLVAAGRLAFWKGFDDLIRAMKIISERVDARLLILGDGPQRSDLERLIAELGLGGRVSLVGYVENPLKYFRSADAFVLSSHVEGLPNVLVEAMMCGCTPVATDCPTGPREVLQDGRFGYLVPMKDPSALAEGILRALERPMPRESLDEAVRPFRAEAVISRHFEVLSLGRTDACASA